MHEHGQERTPPAPPDPEVARQRAEGLWTEVNKVFDPKQQATFQEGTFQLGGGLDSPRLNERLLATLDLTAIQKEAIREMVVKREEENRIRREADRERGPDRSITPEQRRLADEERNKKYAGTDSKNIRTCAGARKWLYTRG